MLITYILHKLDELGKSLRKMTDNLSSFKSSVYDELRKFRTCIRMLDKRLKLLEQSQSKSKELK